MYIVLYNILRLPKDSLSMAQYEHNERMPHTVNAKISRFHCLVEYGRSLTWLYVGNVSTGAGLGLHCKKRIMSTDQELEASYSTHLHSIVRVSNR